MLPPRSSFMSVAEHKAQSPPSRQVRVALLTASDSRTSSDDEGGRTLRDLATAAGFTIVDASLLREEPEALRTHVEGLVAAGTVDAVLVTGGTGLGPRDRTPEAVASLFERRLEGFGEIFRALSFAEIGSAAMLSRADAGVVGGALVFLLPGSPAAVRLAMERLIVPELAHAIGQMRRPVGGEGGGHHGHGHHGHRHG
jgi:molybdenum cofactor biosynthesis protein B